MKNKFTFKTNKSTGPYSSFYPDTHNIKLNKIECGYIEGKKPYKIHLQIIKDAKHTDNNPNCAWIWISLKRESESLKDAKEYLNRIADTLLKQVTLYLDTK